MSFVKDAAIQIISRLRAAGHTAYFAGGCVRDMVRGVEPQDIDIATSARPVEIQQLFSKTIPVGAHFGVVLVLTGGHQFEVATFRTDAEYRDGRRPSAVHFGSPEQDAHRRDFTINGLFFDPVENRFIDYVEGRADIARRLIRTIGEPHARFGEDKLRLLRGVRLASNLGFTIEPATFAAVREMAEQIQAVSAERIRDELIKVFTRPRAGRGLELLEASGLLRVILPEVAAMKGVQQPPEFHPEGDVFQHVKIMLDELPARADVVLAFAVLLHDVGKPPTFSVGPDRIRFHEHDVVGAEMTRRILTRLRFPNETIERVEICVREHMRLRHVQEMRPAKLKRILARATFPTELELHRIDCLASHGSLANYEFLKRKAVEIPPEAVRPARLVTGQDLLALGIPAGPRLGQILHEIEDRQLDEQLTSRAEALAYARQRWKDDN